MNIPNANIASAVKSLIQTHSFFAGILLQQKFVVDNSKANPTAAVDGERFFINSAYADTLSHDYSRFLCAHEACHLSGGHHFRQGNRDGKTWNIACDYVVNALLVKQGFKLIPGALFDARFDGTQSCEDVYKIVYQEEKEKQEKKQADKQGKAGQSGNGSQGQPSPNGQPSPGNGSGNQNASNGTQSPSNGTPSGQSGNDSQDESEGEGEGEPVNPCGEVRKAEGSAKDAEARGKLMVEKALSIARIAGSGANGMEREVNACKSTRYDWREILNRFFTELTARDYSFAHPNKRYLQRGLVLPSLRSRDCGQIVLAIDTSGSVSTEEVSAMVVEMQNCLSTYGENGLSEGLRVIYCDYDVQGDEILQEGDVANPKGGGGTRFAPVFEHLKGDIGQAAALVYLTDGYTMQSDLTALESLVPPFPVLWGLIQDNDSFLPPFGECFRFDIHA